MLKFVYWNFKRLSFYRRPPACPPALRLEPPPLCELPTLRLGELLMLRLGALLTLRLGAEDVLILLLGRELLLLPKLRLGLELLLPTLLLERGLLLLLELKSRLGRELLPTLLLGRELLLLPEPKSRLGREPLRSTLLLGRELLLGVLSIPESGLLTPSALPRSLRPLFSIRLLFSTRPPLFSMRPLLSGRAVTRVELWLLPLKSPRSQRSCIPTCSLLGVRKCSL